MDKETNKSINNFIVSVARSNPGLISAYLFGSAARNKMTPDSDIDIAIVMEKLEDDEKFDKQVELMILASRFDSRFEPHPFSKDEFFNGHPLAVEIRKTGIQIPITGQLE